MKVSLSTNDKVSITAEANTFTGRRAVIGPVLQEVQALQAVEGTHVLTIVVSAQDAKETAEIASKQRAAMVQAQQLARGPRALPAAVADAPAADAPKAKG